MKKFLIPVLIIAIAIFMMGCAEQTTEVVSNPDGFWKGLFHGFTILFSFIGSLFADFKIYAFPNNGFWYNFGFLLGVSMFFGGSGAGARKGRRRKD